MSIINEALRKTQQVRQNESKESISVVSPPVIPLKKTVLLAVAGFAMMVILLVMLLPSRYFQAHKSLPSNKPVALKTNIDTPKMKIMLNGTFVSEHLKMAYINNEVLHVGETINGMKIIAINLDSIILQRVNGSTIELRMGTTYTL